MEKIVISKKDFKGQEIHVWCGSDTDRVAEKDSAFHKAGDHYNVNWCSILEYEDDYLLLLSQTIREEIGTPSNEALINWMCANDWVIVDTEITPDNWGGDHLLRLQKSKGYAAGTM